MKVKKTIQKLKSKKRVVIAAIGDSLTYGSWKVTKGYLDFLSDNLHKKYLKSKFKIFNRGFPGDKAEDGLRRLDEDVLLLDPDLVFIQFGLNDFLNNTSLGKYADAISAMIKKTKENTKAEILLLTSPSLYKPDENKRIKKYHEVLEEIAKKNSLPIIRIDQYWENEIANGTRYTKLLQPDKIHPRVAGYKLMAEAIMDAF